MSAAPLGELMRNHRLACGLRGEDVARAMEVSASSYSRIETGKRSPTIVQLRAFAAVVGVNSWQLLEHLE